MIPDGITPVEGWRSWLIKGDGRLTSTIINHVWDRGVSEAQCLPTESMRTVLQIGGGWPLVTEPHQAPHEDCSCGFYAMRDLGNLRYTGSILGKVAMWGKVIPARHGYRAQYAKPIHLYVLTNPLMTPEQINGLVKKLREGYDCPVGTMPRKKLEERQAANLAASAQVYVKALQSAAAATERTAESFVSAFTPPPTRWERITLWLEEVVFRGWFTTRPASAPWRRRRRRT